MMAELSVVLVPEAERVVSPHRARLDRAAGTEPSMRAIAREAGVGIATLYRHFPTRESLVDAVYRDQVVRLTAGARELLGQLPPAAAMRRWMGLSPPRTSPPRSSASSPWPPGPGTTPRPAAC
jgi:Bacterial regulatory proteins, tetR family